MGDCFSKSSSRFVCSFSMALVIEGLLGGYSFTFLMAVCITPRISIILCCISASAIQFLPFPKYHLIIENECLCVKVKLCLKDHVVYRLLCLGVGKMPQDFVLFFGRQYFKGRDNIFRNGAQSSRLGIDEHPVSFALHKCRVILRTDYTIFSQ